MGIRLQVQVPQVLYLDNDPAQVEAFSYALVDHATVVTARTTEEALRLLQEHPEVSVIVTDLHLDAANGVQFLLRAHAILPDTVNIIVTAGFSDAELLAQAVNSGLVWRVYNKAEEAYRQGDNLAKIVDEAAVEQARRQCETALAVAAREVVRALVQRHEKSKSGRVTRREHLARMMAPYLDMSALELTLLPVFALVHSLDSVVHGANLRELLGDTHVSVSALRPLTYALEDRNESFDGHGPGKKAGAQISPLARVIAVVYQFDRLMAVEIEGGSSVGDAMKQVFAELRSEAGKLFDPQVVTEFEQMVYDNHSAVASLYWRDVK